MPNQRDPDKQVVSVWMSSEMKQHLDKEAVTARTTVGEILRSLIQFWMENKSKCGSSLREFVSSNTKKKQ